MQIQQNTQTEPQTFYVEKDGQQLALLEYSLPDAQTMAILHTEVDDQLRGQNVGYQLVSAAVKYAREHHMMIIPYCPFAHALFKKKEAEFGDVWKKREE